MAGTEHRRYAGRAGRADEFGIAPDRIRGSAVIRVGGEAPEGIALRAGSDLADRAEIGTGEIVGHDRKAVFANPRDRFGEIIDRIVGTGTGAVAACIGRRQLKGGIGFLGPLNQVDDRLAVGA